MKPTQPHKLSGPQRTQVLAMMARGDSYSDINNFLDKQYGLTLAPSSLTGIKQRHADTLAAMQALIQQEEVQGASALLRRSHKILHRKLERAEKDMTELELLDQQYRSNEITSKEYKRKKATLLNVSITEISMLSKNMNDQTKGLTSDDVPPAPAGNKVATDALLAAIKNGDTVELQRLILNPQISDPV